VSLTAFHTQQVKGFARNLGFDYCGIARARKLEADARRLEAWLNKGRQGQMTYLENYFDQRVDPRLLVPGAETVITLLLNYYPQPPPQPTEPKIARYAYGQDYHEVIKKKLNTLLSLIREHIGEVNGRGFVDSAPVLERSWAVLSGLGWVGKNGNLLHPKSGSYFFIATLITDLKLDYDDPFARDYCGTCTRCVEACPTDALLPNKEVDGSKCISYFTIELKEAGFPASLEGKFNDWLFGCDICQEVCPWNRFSQPHQTPEFRALPEILNFTTRDWEALTEERFRELFKRSPLSRAKFSGIQRNLRFLKKKKP
jgi:epoxyqueuosine reductase